MPCRVAPMDDDVCAPVGALFGAPDTAAGGPQDEKNSCRSARRALRCCRCGCNNRHRAGGDPPSATASQAFVAGSPTRDPLRWLGRRAGHGHDRQAGTTGQATDVMLVLDLSGSTGEPPSKFADLKNAANATLAALDAADGHAESVDRRQPRRDRDLPAARRPRLALRSRSSYAALVSSVDTLPAPVGGESARRRHHHGERATRCRRTPSRQRQGDRDDHRRAGDRIAAHEHDDRRDHRQGDRRSHRPDRNRGGREPGRT